MPCKQLTVQEYQDLIAADPTARGYSEQDCPGNCCGRTVAEPGSYVPIDCCICTTVYGWFIYRDEGNLEYRGAPGNVVENPLGFCADDFYEDGPGGILVEQEGPYFGKYQYAPLCKRFVFVDCSYWLQNCGDELFFPEIGAGTTPLCYTTGNCVNGKCSL